MDTAIINSIALPEGKTETVLQFNKLTGAYTSYIIGAKIEDLDQTYFTYAIAMFDPMKDTVVGTYPNFTIAAIADQPQVITEAQLDSVARDKITKVYPVIQQVNVIANTIRKLAVALDIEVPELIEMQNYINEVKVANQLRKDYYAANPDFHYITNEELEAMEAARLEGGLHEVYGARQSEGGSVF